MARRGLGRIARLEHRRSGARAEEGWRRLEEEAGLPQGSIYDESGAEALRHELDYPEIYNSSQRED